MNFKLRNFQNDNDREPSLLITNDTTIFIDRHLRSIEDEVNRVLETKQYMKEDNYCKIY